MKFKVELINNYSDAIIIECRDLKIIDGAYMFLSEPYWDASSVQNIIQTFPIMYTILTKLD